MMDRVHSLTAHYRRSGVLLDTNLLILLLVGTFDPERISSFKRTNRYSSDDYQLLFLLLEPFEAIVTTPNVLTETSNLSGNLGGHFTQAYFTAFIERVRDLHEIYTPSLDVMEKPEFLRLGLTDIGLVDIAVGQYLLLTDDLDLHAWAIERGAGAVHFSQIRSNYLLG